MAKTSYVIALGSNRRHHRHGSPDAVLAAACAHLAERGLAISASAPIFRTAAVGPAGRSFANSAILAESDLDPPALLHLLKQHFTTTMHAKPKASRAESAETYLLARGFKGNGPADSE